jgi:hypothetical protein
VSIGKVFGEADLAEKEVTEVVGEGEGDFLDKINDFITNIDSLLTHLVDIKEKHPEILSKFNLLRGGNPVYQGQFSPTNQPIAEGKIVKRISPEKLYGLLLGVLHSLEGQNLTIEQAKQLLIKNKVAVMLKIKEAIPSLEE